MTKQEIPLLKRVDAESYDKAAKRHRQFVESGDYGYDSVILEALYKGFATGSPVALELAAVAIADVAEGMREATSEVDADPQLTLPEVPKGNASREEWAKYAVAIGCSIDSEMSRNQIRERVKAKELHG